MASQPRATLNDIKEILGNNGIILNTHYICRLREKIRTERAVRYDQAKVNARIAEMQDKMEEVQKVLWKIILDNSVYTEGMFKGKGKVSIQNKINAAVAIVRSEKDLLDAQMDAGVFERKLGTIENDLKLKIEDGEKDKIITALKNYGIIGEVKEAEFKEIE
jgi:hypothetical protein